MTSKRAQLQYITETGWNKILILVFLWPFHQRLLDSCALACKQRVKSTLSLLRRWWTVKSFTVNNQHKAGLWMHEKTEKRLRIVPPRNQCLSWNISPFENGTRWGGESFRESNLLFQRFRDRRQASTIWCKTFPKRSFLRIIAKWPSFLSLSFLFTSHSECWMDGWCVAGRGKKTVYMPKHIFYKHCSNQPAARGP